MANIRAGSLVVDIRGRVGTEIYSRNSAGPIVRSAGSWVQPDTQRQLDARAVITALSQAWSGTLSDAQRKTWRTYGRQWPRPNKFGEVTITNGYLAFIRCNALHYRQYTALGFLVAPPAGPIHPPTFTFDVDAGEAGSLTLPPTNYLTPRADLRLFLHGGQQVNPGVDYFSGPWRYIGVNTRCADCLSGSGNPDPDSEGIYHRDGDYDSHPVYKRTDEAYYLHWTSVLVTYVISTVPQQTPASYWEGPGTLTGTYEGSGAYTGDVEIVDVGWTVDPWTFTWPFGVDATKKVYAYLVAQHADTGEISTPYRTTAIVGA